MARALVEELRPGLLAAASYEAARSEGGRRLPAYSAWKWWGRRFSVLARLILASLVLVPGEESVLLDVLLGGRDAESVVSARAAGRLIVDPFAGGGTILAEAAKLGFNAYGVDVDSAAVAVARATLSTVCGGCRRLTGCLAEALAAAWRRVGWLWSPREGVVVVHVFLARCSNGVCEAPAWLSTLRRGRRGPERILVLDPSTATGLRVVEGGEVGEYRPEHPVVRLPGWLPEEARGLRAYALELYEPSTGRRWFEPLYTPGAVELREWLASTMAEAERLAGKACTPVPPLREALRLLRGGVECWENLYTPRQLVSLRAFVEEAELRGCGAEARLVAGSVTRTASLLAIYYQPYSKVNPGLVVKSYWMPRYPVELNPLAHRLTGSGLRSLGRGTVASHIAMLRRACRSSRECRGWYRVVEGRAEDPALLPGDAYAVVTDPPYPGMQSYADLSLPYHYWLSGSLPAHSPARLRGRAYVELMERFAGALASRLRRGAPLVLMLGAPRRELATLARALAAVAGKGFGLQRVYWVTGEASGVLGRSSSRGVYVAVLRLGYPHRSDALEPLGWVERIIGMMPGEMVERLAIDSSSEAAAARRLAAMLQAFIPGVG